jgi:hypothetical protein
MMVDASGNALGGVPVLVRTANLVSPTSESKILNLLSLSDSYLFSNYLSFI